MAEQLQNMFHLVEQEMEAYNRTFESYMMTDNPLLHSILTNMSEHRGKGMRPLITILSAKLFGNVQEITYHLAAAYELFHNATLIHDDIIDESDTRRGQPSVYSWKRFSGLRADWLMENFSNSTTSALKKSLNRIISISSKRKRLSSLRLVPSLER